MAEQIKKRPKPVKPPIQPEKAVQNQAGPKPQSQVDQQGLSDLLDEIDEVLEENAEAFVKSYVQKGGE